MKLCSLLLGPYWDMLQHLELRGAEYTGGTELAEVEWIGVP